MRLFAALDIPDSVKTSLSDWQQDVGEHLDDRYWHLVSPHLWHLTLAFYGDVGGDDAIDLAESLADCSMQPPVINLKTEAYGVFPKPHRASVFWVGVTDAGAGSDLKHLARCCRRVGHATVRKRTAKEAVFSAHITMARCRAKRQLKDCEYLSLMPPVPQLNWCVNSLSLFQSILKPEGPQYHRLETFKFNRRGMYVR